MKKYKVIVAGSRILSDYITVEKILNSVFKKYDNEEVEIVSGGARGADALGELYAKNHNIDISVFKADWDKYKKAAGAIRNRQMADYGTSCIVFWDGISKGSKNMIEQAQKVDMPVLIYNFNNNEITTINSKNGKF